MSLANMTKTIAGYEFTWPDNDVCIRIFRIKESSRGTFAELEVGVNGTKNHTLTHQSINLLAGRTRLQKELVTKHEAPWESLLEQTFVRVLREHRTGQPVEQVTPAASSGTSQFILNPMLYYKNPTVLYGPGGSMKSMLALYAGMLLASGCTGANLACSPEPWRVLYLDWEMSLDDLNSRAANILAGDPRLTGTPDYRRCYRPLMDDIADLQKIVADNGYEVLILDSLALAAGAQELERSEAPVQFYAALRSLNCTSLILGHTPKPMDDEPRERRTLYGSVFFTNLARVAWEVRRDGSAMGLYLRKNNLGPDNLKPLGFRLTMTETSTAIEECDVSDEPELATALPLMDRIAKELRERPGQTPKEIAERLGAKQPSVRAKLAALYGKRFMNLNGKWSVIAY